MSATSNATTTAQAEGMSHEEEHGHAHSDPFGDKMGMWLFLYTELLLFGGMFIMYGMYLWIYPLAFQYGSGHLDTFKGGLNTVVLLTSSLTMALSIAAIQRNKKKLSIICLSLTIAMAGLFFVVKYMEWSHKIHDGIYPGSATLMKMQDKPVSEVDLRHHVVTPETLKEMGHTGDTLGKGIILFYGLYYMMTGLHALHVLAGAILLIVLLVMIIKNKQTQERHLALENSGLYWHLVDLIWIYLFPLFYLIR